MIALTIIPSRTVTALPCSTDPEKWYDTSQEDAAKRACTDCPVRETCLSLALAANEPWGVWGGYNPAERAHLATDRSRNSTTATITRLAAEGLTDKSIAERLGWKPWQVKEHRRRHHIPSIHPKGGKFRWPDARLKPCGTDAAYERHKRRGEPVDEACREAHRIAAAEKRVRLKGSRNT